MREHGKFCSCSECIAGREAATEAAAREREQEEKRMRASNLHEWLRGVHVDSSLDDTAISFDFGGHRYEIREVED